MSKREYLLENGYKAYENDEIIVYWNPELCQHATECIRGNSQVFDVNRRPWINLSLALAEEIGNIIEKCPSGALKYEYK